MKLIALGMLSLTLAACGSSTNRPRVPIVPTSPIAEATELPVLSPSVGDKKDQYYRNCTEAKEAGAAPLRRGADGGYRAALDRDNDGIACD